MAKRRTNNKKDIAKFQTPSAYIVTGIVMWIVAYVLFLLAADSGSNIEWLGFFLAFIWGCVRLVQGIRQKIINL